jgi:hypothetical protein
MQADGNIIQVFHKNGGPTKGTMSKPITPVGPRADRPNPAGRSGYDSASDRPAPRAERRRDYESRAEVVDGSYGFDERMDTDDQDNYKDGRRLYSDEIGGRGRDDRDRVTQRGRGFR